MALIATFAVFAVIGQTLNVTLALVIERQTSAFTSIIAFFVGMLVVIWVAWRLTLWLTKPGRISRLLHREKSSDAAQAGR
jgi:hypothetical protein